MSFTIVEKDHDLSIEDVFKKRLAEQLAMAGSDLSIDHFDGDLDKFVQAINEAKLKIPWHVMIFSKEFNK